MNDDRGVPGDLARYLATRERDRGERVNETLAALTPRERALVTEAAVAGYVRGTLAAGGFDVRIPPDTIVLRDVVGACLVVPDLYPALTRYEETRGEHVSEYYTALAGAKLGDPVRVIIDGTLAGLTADGVLTVRYQGEDGARHLTRVQLTVSCRAERDHGDGDGDDSRD